MGTLARTLKSTPLSLAPTPVQNRRRLKLTRPLLNTQMMKPCLSRRFRYFDPYTICSPRRAFHLLSQPAKPDRHTASPEFVIRLEESTRSVAGFGDRTKALIQSIISLDPDSFSLLDEVGDRFSFTRLAQFSGVRYWRRSFVSIPI